MCFSEGVLYPDCLCFYPSRFQGSLQLCLRDCGERMQERKAAVIRAEGESESARLISEATKVAGPGLIELRRIEAAKDIASSLSKVWQCHVPAGHWQQHAAWDQPWQVSMHD